GPLVRRSRLPTSDFRLSPDFRLLLACQVSPDVALDVAVALGRDDAGVEPGEVEASGEPGMLDLQAPVLDDFEPGIDRFLGRLVVAEPALEPDGLGTEGDRLFDDLRQAGGLAEAVDDVGHLRKILQ